MNEVVKIGFENIERIQFDKLEKDFSFIVNDQIYRTNSIVAAILSPRISNLLEENMKISYYKINPKYDGDFNRIIEYGNMKTLSIKEDENQYFENVMRELGNTNELFRFNKFFRPILRRGGQAAAEPHPEKPRYCAFFSAIALSATTTPRSIADSTPAKFAMGACMEPSIFAMSSSFEGISASALMPFASM